MLVVECLQALNTLPVRKTQTVGRFFFTVPVRPRFAALATLNKLKDVELLLPSFRGHQEQPLHQKLLIINSKPFSRGRGRVLTKKFHSPVSWGLLQQLFIAEARS